MLKVFLSALFCLPSILAAPSQVQQIFDGQQTTSGFAGEKRHAGVAGSVRKRRLLVLHPAILQGEIIGSFPNRMETVFYF